MRAPIDLRIGTLALHGVPAHHREAVGAALCEELRRLLGSTDLGPALSGAASRPRLRAEMPAARPGQRPEELGAAIAQAIFRSLRGSG